MKDKLSDLNEYLFAQLEKIQDEDLTEEQLNLELKRTSAICKVGSVIVKNAGMVLKGMEFAGQSAERIPFLREEKKAHPVFALKEGK